MPNETMSTLTSKSCAECSPHQPCPFCGDRDIRTFHRGHPTAGEWVVECKSCSCELTGFASQTEAWKRWNKRPSSETLPQRVFDLTAELRRYFESGTLNETSDLYLLLCEIEQMRGSQKAEVVGIIGASEVGREAYLKAWDFLSEAERDEWIKRGLGQ